MYKLKDNVTDEMLKSVGFNNNSYGALQRNTNDGKVIFADIDTKIIYMKEISSKGFKPTEMHSSYIRDLFEKGLVELI